MSMQPSRSFFSRLFNRSVAEKSNPAFAAVTAFNDVPQPHTMPRNYKNYADQGYAANDSVFKCVQYIVTNGAAIPPKLYTDRTMETEIQKHPLLDRLAAPNNEQDGVTFREAVLGWYLIAGNAFLYAIRSGKTQGPPDELWTLEPTKVHPLPHPTQGIVGYEFDDFDDNRNPIPPANIGHLKTWNPKDPIFGLSPIEVGALLIDQQNAARKWNLALMQNMGKPSGAWVIDAAVDKNTRDRLEERVNEKLAGARNAGKVAVLDAGAKWQGTSLPPSELDWLESQKYNAGQLANLYNIPPQLIGDTSATTYNNMEQAKEASYTEAIFPALDKFYSFLTMWLVPMYPDLRDAAGKPKAYLYYDKNTVEVVQKQIQVRDSAKADRAIKAYMAGTITLNQAQKMQGLPDLGPKGNVYRIGAVLVPADKLDEYAGQSLTTPAAPPIPAPEPIQTPPAPGAPPQPVPKPQDGSQEPPPKKARKRRRRKSAGDTGVVYILWECDAEACDFCLDNDGVIVAEGDQFPNGCTGPDDSHRFCKCTAFEVALPDLTSGILADLIAGDATFDDVEMPGGGKLPKGTELTDDGEVLLPDGTLITADGVTLPSGATLTLDGTILSANGHEIASQSDASRTLLSAADRAALASLFAVGVIESRHARDVAARNAQQQQSDEGDDFEDVSYAKSRKTTRKQRREAYRRFMAETMETVT